MRRLKPFFDFLREFFAGAFDCRGQLTKIVRKEGHEKNDEFMLLCFSDILGIPNPTSYYTLELLPLLAEELEGWERRMMQRKEIAGDKFAQYDFC